MKGSGAKNAGQTPSLKGATLTPPLPPLYPQDSSMQAQYFKVCVSCDIEKPITHFEKANHGTTFRAVCKKCRNASRGKRVKRQVEFTEITCKICAKCKIDKPIDQFNKYKMGRGGTNSYCRDCQITTQRALSAIRVEKKKEIRRLEYESMNVVDRPKAKVCSNTNCLLSGIIQPPENFNKSKIHRTGLVPDCTTCETIRRHKSFEKHKDDPKDTNVKERYKNDPDRKEYSKRWYQEHKEELNRMTKEWRKANPGETRRLHIK